MRKWTVERRNTERERNGIGRDPVSEIGWSESDPSSAVIPHAMFITVSESVSDVVCKL